MRMRVERMARAARLAGLAGLLPLAVSGAQGVPEARPAPEPPAIMVSGTGEARMAPDRATVQMGVQSRASTAAAAAAENARKQRAVIDTLKGLGIRPEQIGTTQFSVYPEQRMVREGEEPRIVAYVVSNVVRVELQRLELVGAAVDAGLAKGANQIHSLDFWASNTDAARQQALSQAVAKARAEAEVIARAAGGSLGPLLEISSAGFGVPVPMVRRARTMDMATAASAPTPMEPGQETITVTVTARWAFVDSRR